MSLAHQDPSRAVHNNMVKIGVQNLYVRHVFQGRNPVWSRGAPHISSLDIELTERCNNKCIHCSICLDENDPHAIRKELTTQQWKKILDEAADLGALSVRLTGGEPLLRDDFEEIYVYARRLGLKVRLFTNARLISSKLAQLFARIPPLEMIEVSVYGMTVGTYEKVSRIPGSFGEFRNGLDNLSKFHVPFMVKGVWLPQNENDIERISSWARTLPNMDRPPAFALFLELRARRDSSELNRVIESLRVPVERILEFYNQRRWGADSSFVQYCKQFVGDRGTILFPCGRGCDGCVDAYGRWQPCLSVRHPVCTFDLHHGTIKQAMTRFRKTFARRNSRNPEYLARCARCFLMGLCEQCPGYSWSEHGTLDTPVEYLCTLSHLWACQLGWLNLKEKAWEVSDGRVRIKRWAAQVNNPTWRNLRK